MEWLCNVNPGFSCYCKMSLSLFLDTFTQKHWKMYCITSRHSFERETLSKRKKEWVSERVRERERKREWLRERGRRGVGESKRVREWERKSGSLSERKKEWVSERVVIFLLERTFSCVIMVVPHLSPHFSISALPPPPEMTCPDIISMKPPSPPLQPHRSGSCTHYSDVSRYIFTYFISIFGDTW